MRSTILAFFVLWLGQSSGYHFLEDVEEPDMPYFPEEYRVLGEKISMTSQLITPFEAWYSTEYNRSRIDYFGGMVKTYYYAGSEYSNGSIFEIHPISNEEVTDEMLCYESTYEGEQMYFLPYPEGYQLIGYEEINGKNTEKWTKSSDSEDDKLEETLWINYIDKNRQAVPVRYEFKVYNNWLSNLAEHTIENYFEFDAKVDSGDLEIESEIECKFKKVKKGDLDTLAFVAPEDDEDVDIVFSQYKNKHNRQYETEYEHQIRRNIFRRNLKKVINTNHKRLGYTLALNKFADRTEQELRHLAALKPSQSDDVGTIPFPYKEDEINKLADDFPKEYDMRLDGLITPVQNQGMCGSCWAFALAATIEGALARKNGGRAMRLSEQAQIDCAWGYSADGCDGAYVDEALYFLLKHGVPTDEDYGPYLAMVQYLGHEIDFVHILDIPAPSLRRGPALLSKPRLGTWPMCQKLMDGYCRMQEMPSVQTIKGFTKVTPYSENALKVAVYNHGPVAVQVYASDEMVLYSGGVFYDISCDRPEPSINHVMTVVGYGERYGETYFIVKNSWGQDWGSDGYILMSAKNNNCMVLSEPYYVTV